MHRLRQVDVAQGPLIWKALPSFLHFVGGRPLVGYYVDFDIAMLDKYILPFIEIELPNPRIEVSKLYYERKYGDAPPNTSIDLSFAAILRDLNIPRSPQHDAFNDALMTAMMYVALRDMKERGYASRAPARMLPFSIRQAHEALLQRAGLKSILRSGEDDQGSPIGEAGRCMASALLHLRFDPVQAPPFWHAFELVNAAIPKSEFQIATSVP